MLGEPEDEAIVLSLFSVSPISISTGEFCRHLRFACIFVVILIFCTGVVSIVVWLTVINKQNTEPQVTYANLFEVIQLDDMLHP